MSAQILPACYLFLSFAWLGSLYNAYHDFIQLYTVYFQHFKHTSFVDGLPYTLDPNSQTLHHQPSILNVIILHPGP